MGRPAPRKSSLAGRTPVTPPPADPALADPAPPAAAPAVQEQPAAVAPEKKGKYPPKVSFYQDPADTARVRGAILHTQVAEGTRSLSDFINNAVMAEVHRLEASTTGVSPSPESVPGACPKAAPWDANASGKRVGHKGIATQPEGWVAIPCNSAPAAGSGHRGSSCGAPRSCQEITVMFAACSPLGPCWTSN